MALLTLLNQTSWGSRPDGDANDNHRMTPRARRSESITLPPGNHPGLIRYNDEKRSFTSGSVPNKEEEESGPPIYRVKSDDAVDYPSDHDEDQLRRSASSYDFSKRYDSESSVDSI